MKLKSLLIAGLATGLLALGGWKAFSHFKAAAPAGAQAHRWVCPMRCLGRVYDHPGECPVCHMKLNPVAATERKIIGYICPLHYSQKLFDQPGRCPFCTLEMKPVYSTAQLAEPPRPHLNPWEELDGKTAVYFRPYTVRKVQADRVLRLAGRIQGTLMSAQIAVGEGQGLRPGLSAMIMPPQGYSRPAFGVVEAVSLGHSVLIRSPHAFPGLAYALAEIRLPAPPALAVPAEALAESDGQARVFVKRGDAFVPQAVKVTARGESYVSLSGVAEGDVVAGSGVFWLEAQWRMDHAGMADLH